MYFLFDATSFYCSAEKVYSPHLRKRGVITLSNNDGAVVAVCPIAKKLGVKKFVPFFQIKDLVNKHNIVVTSSNYELYSSLSLKMMQTIEQFTTNSYIYSIDEIFAHYDKPLNHSSWLELGNDVRKTVWKEVRLPIGVGGGATPTLAKAASHAAKRIEGYRGIAVISTEQERVAILKQMGVTDVWGVGNRIGRKLELMGIHTAYQLSQKSPTHMRKQFSILMENTIRELNGEPRIAWDDVRADKQQIYSTRTFGERVVNSNELHRALIGHCEAAMVKLRKQKSLAGAMTVFASNSPHDDTAFYRKSVFHQFAVPTLDTRVTTNAIQQLVDKIFKPGISFYRCGVGLLDIRPQAHFQTDLFAPAVDNPNLMHVLDAINTRYGKSTMQMASKGFSKKHEMRREYITKRATTRWSDIPVIKC
jgi:DNA polymerase V